MEGKIHEAALKYLEESGQVEEDAELTIELKAKIQRIVDFLENNARTIFHDYDKVLRTWITK